MCSVIVLRFFFFFQAEDGIRDKLVTGVQTCALPISVQAAAGRRLQRPVSRHRHLSRLGAWRSVLEPPALARPAPPSRCGSWTHKRPRPPRRPPPPIDARSAQGPDGPGLRPTRAEILSVSLLPPPATPQRSQRLWAKLVGSDQPSRLPCQADPQGVGPARPRLRTHRYHADRCEVHRFPAQ